MKTVISLSTIPSRFNKIQPTLRSLLAQSAKIDSVRLYIPKYYKRFPDYDGSIPEVPDGVQLFRTETDFGPASKLLHCLKDFRNQPDTRILFCDDDHLYSSNWASGLLESSISNEDCAICVIGLQFDEELRRKFAISRPKLPQAVKCNKKLDFGYRIRRIKQQIGTGRFFSEHRKKPPRRIYMKSGHVDAFQGVGGVIVKPRFFDDAVFDVPDQGFYVDDIWLSANVLKNGYGIWAQRNWLRPKLTEADTVDALYLSSFHGKQREDLNIDCITFCQDKFGVWKQGHDSQPDRPVQYFASLT
jgi:hypothetical protein